MKKKFLFSKTGDQYLDFNSKMSELILDLENNFGSPVKMKLFALQQLQINLQNAPAEDIEKHLWVANFFRNAAEVMQKHHSIFLDRKYELRSYTDGRWRWIDEVVRYMDHPEHKKFFNHKKKGNDTL